jgi:hypothetical protein
MQLFPRRRRWEGWGRSTLLNPTKWVFADVRRWVEGRRYESIEAKQAAVGGRRLKAEKRVLSLVGWRYIREAFHAFYLEMVLQRRKAIGEPIFGAIKRVFGFWRWSQRGLEGVRAQWYWLYTALNLRKVYGL